MNPSITFQSLSLETATSHPDFQSLPFRPLDFSLLLPKPILVMMPENGARYQVIGGIQRFEAARAAGAAQLPAYLVERMDSPLDLLKLAADYYTPLTLIDKARLIGIARNMGFSKTRIAAGLFEALDIPPQNHLVNDYLFLLKLPRELQQLVVEKDLSLKRALIFQRAAEHLDWVVQLIKNLHLGINMTAEIIQNIWEMAQRDKTDFRTKAEQVGLWELADEPSEDPRPVVLDIRAKINAARMPLLTAAGARLRQTIDDLNLPDSVKIKWDPYFEKQGIELTFHAKDLEELRTILRRLNAANPGPVFDQI